MQFKEEKEKSEISPTVNIFDKKAGINKLLNIICIQLNLIKDTVESIENSIQILQEVNEGNNQG